MNWKCVQKLLHKKFGFSRNSSYNLLEVDMTMDYLRRIFKLSERVISQSDIGIISPYRRQCEQLVEKCASNGYHNIQIGSVEVYQGQEKPIIICSTVRSQMDNVGFLNSKKVQLQLHKFRQFSAIQVVQHCFFGFFFSTSYVAFKCTIDESKMLANNYR